MRIIEQTLHAWDIASSVGGDTHLDEGLCDHILTSHRSAIERLRAHGFYAPPVGTDSTTPAQRSRPSPPVNP